jgi:hypothetical protein
MDFGVGRLAAVKRVLPSLAAFLLGIAWFFWVGLGEAASPFHLRWSFNEDWSTGTMGFLLYRNAPWRFPLGFIPNYVEPAGTTIGYTDGIPALAPLAKLLSPLLPLNFQYIGPVWCLSYGLLALVGERIVARRSADPVQRVLGGTLFVLSPVLAARSGHPTLCAMFLPVLALHLATLRTATFASARRRFLALLALAAFVAGNHPYLAVMTGTLLVAAAASHVIVDKVVPARWVPVWLGAPVAVLVFFFWVYGFIGFQEMEKTADGFGDFSMDLLALVNPVDRSRFFRGLPQQGRQIEGLAYLGSGVFLLLTARLLLAFRRRRPRQVLRRVGAALRTHGPLLVALGGLTFFALSWAVRARGIPVLNLDRSHVEVSLYPAKRTHP